MELWLPGVGGREGMNRQGAEGFYGSENALCDAIMMDIFKPKPTG